jgi:nanoRNase/pAp phosphatase (c-di-AMP/oligoRNAs hydrolase)
MRLLTRSDFDGLVCAVLLVEKGIVDSYKFVHPKDVQDGVMETSKDDVLANIPYLKGCGLWFDHHSSEKERLEMKDLDFEGSSKPAPSAAQVIWEYYGGEETFGAHFNPLMVAVNKTDSGDLTKDEILNPEGWILLSFIMDPRTGLGRFQDYRISNYNLMQDMIQYCRTKTAEEILAIPDVKERTERYTEQVDLYKEMITRCVTIKENVLITNLMNEETIYSGNRFYIYAMYPEQNIEARVMWGRAKQNVVFACGHSIVNRSSITNVGKLMLKFGGGGHRKVGTCQVPLENWEKNLDEIIEQMTEHHDAEDDNDLGF